MPRGPPLPPLPPPFPGMPRGLPQAARGDSASQHAAGRSRPAAERGGVFKRRRPQDGGGAGAEASSMSGGQRTLFQSWGSRAPGPRREAAPGGGARSHRAGPGAAAVEETEAAVETVEATIEKAEAAVGTVEKAEAAVGTVEKAEAAVGTVEEAEAAAEDALLAAAAAEAERSGFCAAAGALWIYPSNWAVRGYQERLARAALLANTLVCLPTGLGKTFVAAVVLYNFYRWFPSAKALFLAPTKPLVAQQREACARVMGIPAHHMAEMTGGTQVLNRKEIWHNKRVFFLTPQIMVNDLSRGTCPAAEIKCLVIDEAHKALGNHAYCQVVRELCKYTTQFRVLALSATPGSDTKAVQEVISNLLIAQIELCSEDSPDIRPYSHARQIEKCVVPLGKELSEIQNAYIRILETFAGRLIKIRVLAQRDIPSLTKYQIIIARDQFRKNPSSHNAGIQQGIIEGDFALCISLYHGYELLLQMGTRSLFIFLCGIMDGSKGLTRTRNELSRNEDFMKLYQELENMFSDTSVTSANGNLLYNRTGPKNKIIYSHPKLKKLEEVVVEHFKSWKGYSDQSTSDSKASDTRVMIFSSFRDSVQEIAEILSQHHPIVRVMTFVGHSTGKSMKGFSQKEQLEVVKRFREGGYNTLVSTCVGEEGLDIGEVDLIVCFDAQKSPIRLVQRMGRTGRKRQGRIVVILAEGREERTYNQSQSNKKSIYKAISENKMLHFYQQSPRMIPEGITPKLHKMFITPAISEPNNSRSLSKERRSSSLHHKSALFSMGSSTKQTDSHENWCLTSEEFEEWSRLYKLKESDGVKEPILPQSHFETLENMEEIAASQAEDAHKLSLSEWRLWQNRPFPTHLVDHSARCFHFIDVMEMIELMRHEEGDCSYELEIQPYLNMNDIKTSDAQRTKCLSTSNSKAQKGFSSRKNVAQVSKAKLGSYSLSELDTECISLFKATNFKSTKRTSALNLEVPVLCTEVNISDSFSTAEDPTSECTGQKSLPDDHAENMTFGSNKCSAPIDLSGNATSCVSEVVKEYKSVNKACSSLERNCVDSGYSSLTDEKSPVSSSLFYLPESELDSFALKPPTEDPSFIKILTNVKRLLSQSPPPLNKLDNYEGLERTREDKIEQTVSFQKVISNTFLEGLQGKTCDTFTEFLNPSLPPQKCSELNVPSKLCSSLSSCPSEPSFLSEAFVGKINNGLSWGGIFSCDSGERTEIQKENPTMVDHVLTNSPSDRNSVDGYKKDSEKFQKNMATDQDESVNLFEDEHFFDANNASLSKYNCEQFLVASVLCDKDIAPSDGQISEWHISDECFDANPRESLINCGTKTLKVSEDLGIVNKPFLDNEDLYDCSQELFPVNFDLGFSIQESEEEILEQTDMHTSVIHNSDGLLGICADVKPSRVETELSNSNLRHTSPPKLKDESTTRTNCSTPLSSPNQNSTHAKLTENCIPLISPLKQAEEKEHGSYDSLASTFSTPKGRKVMNVKVLKRISMNAFSRVMQEIPQVLPPKKVLLNSAFDTEDLPSGKTENLDHRQLHVSQTFPVEGSSSESEEEIVFQRRHKKKGNVLKSPDVQNNSDFESPVHAVKKRRHPVNTSESSSDEGIDFHKKSNKNAHCDMSHNRKQLKGVKRQKSNDFIFKSAARQFLDEEAELSLQEAGDISSDESDSENELHSSLNQFLNDETQFTEVLNDSEMEGVYLKSVRSPAVGNRYKMVHKGFNSMAVFSQIPEQDEAYLADSFCVEEAEEGSPRQSGSSEEEEVSVRFDLVQDERSASGRKQYCTRRRVALHQAKMQQNCAAPLTKKRSRIVVLDDSSGEETNVSNQRLIKNASPRTDHSRAHSPTSVLSDSPGEPKAPGGNSPVPQPLQGKGQTLLNLKASVSDVLDFQPEGRGTGRRPSLAVAALPGDEDFQARLQVEGSSNNLCADASNPRCSGPERNASLCILVDSREISSGSEIISCLKAEHGVKVQVCSLGGCDYIVSTRMAVERRTQSELLNSLNRTKVIQRIQQLQSMFERICVIVEKDRVKAGETSRLLQRTKYYDGLLAAFIRAGIRILFSSCQEESASLLKDLAMVEQRKNVAIQVPTEVRGAKEAALRFYLSIPNISHLAALHMCHGFESVKKMANSSPRAIATCARVSLQKAEEIYRYLHSGFDLQVLPEKHPAQRSST
ncbi:Fanconi anemia group M protein isoform X2 [Pelodiscus sinensis]|uniref:Fanconi anemia group M protein isoform X2 n=1 Tax=Pelodiscus sinensis TaxID=13735 RepID=UPI003F6AB588